MAAVVDRDIVIKEYEQKIHQCRLHALGTALFKQWGATLSFFSIIWAGVLLVGATQPNPAFIAVLTVNMLSFVALDHAPNEARVPSTQDPRLLVDTGHAVAPRLAFNAFPLALLHATALLFCWQGIATSSNMGITAFNAVSALGFTAHIWSWVRLGTRPRVADSVMEEFYVQVMSSPSAGNDFLQFAFRSLGSHFRRLERPHVVYQANKGLYDYVCAHRSGLDCVIKVIEDGDCFQQRAALCMVGSWPMTNVKGIACGIGNEVFLLRAVLSRVGRGQSGWDALRSLQALADDERVDISDWARHMPLFQTLGPALRIKFCRIAVLGLLASMARRGLEVPSSEVSGWHDNLKYLEHVLVDASKIKAREIILTSYVLYKLHRSLLPATGVDNTVVHKLCQSMATQPDQYVDPSERRMLEDMFKSIKDEPNASSEFCFEWDVYRKRNSLVLCKVVIKPLRHQEGDAEESSENIVLWEA